MGCWRPRPWLQVGDFFFLEFFFSSSTWTVLLLHVVLLCEPFVVFYLKYSASNELLSAVCKRAHFLFLF